MGTTVPSLQLVPTRLLFCLSSGGAPGEQCEGVDRVYGSTRFVRHAAYLGTKQDGPSGMGEVTFHFVLGGWDRGVKLILVQPTA
ncbi:MAG TPA: hypothetical protein VLE46_00530 [Nitrospira sp.]|nr:hypothetical protein [Nitrospira sp.]